MKAALAGVANWLGSLHGGRAARAVAAPAPDSPEPASPRPGLPAPASSGPAPPVPDPPGAWTPARLRLLAALWGEGFIGPGGEEEALRLSKPLGLGPSHSLLILGAGLGGAARAIAAASGAWVTAYEQDGLLAAAGEAISKREKLDKKAEVKPLDPAAPAFRSNYYHHALVQEALWTVADKDRLVAALAAAVKPGGQVVITDITTAASPLPAGAPPILAWLRLDRSPAHLVSPKENSALLARHGLDIRIAEEISARHVRQAVAAWRDLIGMLGSERPSAGQAMRIVAEAELWLRRLALIREGRIGLMRWHAIRR